jgi:hypothetical protein
MQHQWVSITIVPVTDIIAQEGQEPAIYTAPADKEDTQYGCSHCSAPLTSDTMDEECPGDD